MSTSAVFNNPCNEYYADWRCKLQLMWWIHFILADVVYCWRFVGRPELSLTLQIALPMICLSVVTYCLVVTVTSTLTFLTFIVGTLTSFRMIKYFYSVYWSYKVIRCSVMKHLVVCWWSWFQNVMRQNKQTNRQTNIAAIIVLLTC